MLLGRWDKSTYDIINAAQDKERRKQGQLVPGNTDPVDEEGRQTAEQAREIREAGRKTWEPSWKKYGRTEVGPPMGVFDMSSYQRQHAHR